MMKKKITLLIAASLLAIASVASAANKAETLSFTPVIGAYLFDGKQHLEANVMYGARLGYNFTDAFGIEALFDYSHNNESTHPAIKPGISMFRYGGELLYHFNPSGMFVPYVAAGYAGVNFDGNSDGTTDKGYKQTKGAFDYGIGAKLFLSENFAFRGDVRQIIYTYDKTYSNYESTIGIYFAFGGAAPVVKPVEPAPAPVVVLVETSPAAPLDSDGDGVPDTLDKCSNTPAGVAVGADGCPLDADKDGVPDYLDKCPNTSAGVTVGTDGCPLDADKDGVADSLDKCPNTPVGVAVGTDGCPLDADKDGVADSLDKCPNTPVSVTVGKNGCPLDADKDGVPDYLDKCPNTPAGVKVGTDGCPEVAPALKAAAAKRYCSKPAVIAIQFDTNKAEIKSQYHDELNTLGDFLTYFPKAKGEIAGHADNVGSKGYNVNLSQARADSVKQYLVDTFGIDAARITTKGYGESKPISSNKTKAGRAKNRRIVANFSCEG
jgi:OmpA-OmpF porin, OOP family